MFDKMMFGELEVGFKVSVECSFCVGDEIGGYEVVGYVMGIGIVCEVSVSDECYDFWVEVLKEWIKYI